jgi:hypothetical protein
MKLRFPLLAPAILLAAAPASPETKAAQTGAAVADLAWLVGAWEGQGIGGAPAVEVYSPAAGGQIVGHFRQLNPNGSVMFYELVTIGVRDGVLTYALKHFNADLTGWEDSKTVQKFPLKTATAVRWDFSGIVYERTGPDSMTASVAIKEADGRTGTLTFRFKRKKP